MKNKKTTDTKKVPSNSEIPSMLVDPPAHKVSFPIVGIGASAGGLAAFETFFSGMPEDTDPGMAFVLVQHLAPDHKSILAELIRRYTRMQVFEVKDNMIIEPNCAYIIPPGYDMALHNGALHLFEPFAPHGLRLPIDFFFRSLAQDQCDRAIAIVLSGNGSDGTMGVRAIKGGGGMVMVQTLESAEYDGMPRSVIATGLVDYELPPAEMATALIAYSSKAFNKNISADTVPAPKYENTLKKIFILMRAQTGHDFSSYKQNTVRRRIERRMAVHQIDSIEKYLKYLQQSNEEINALFKDLLIGVTNFFRDVDSFNSLNETVIPKLFTGKSAGSLIRVWSAGCSTGEEAYSIAILIQEHMESLKQIFTVQIFATDIDPRAISSARAGIYPASIAADITPERLERFFTSESGFPDIESQTYRINKSIRDMLIFSEQNLINDPPFSQIDLICCRNLMIYLGNDLQKKLIPIFHYSLNPNGFLFLGTSESVGEFTNLFQLIDRKSKLYLRKDNALNSRYTSVRKFFPPNHYTEVVSPVSNASKPLQNKTSPRELAEKTLLKHLAPPSALVNGKGDIFYLHGRTGMYLEPTVGEVDGYNMIKMAREGLRHKLSTSLRKAVQGNNVVICPNLSVKTNGGYTTVNLTICPVPNGGKTSFSDQLFLIILEEGKLSEPGHVRQTFPQTALISDSINEKSDHHSLEGLVASLRSEIREKEENLQTTIEELETSNEELKSTNEEMQSINEELQSTNEELETSKEELQSVNEELSTVNNELAAKVADLSKVNNDINNLLSGTGIATVFVNHQQQIIRFTPTAIELINLIPADVGRPVNHILTNLSSYNDLSSDIQSVLDYLIPKTIEVQTVKGDWYRMNILPYRTMDNVIEGAVINFVDITELRKLQNELQNQLSEKETLLREVHHRVKNNIANIESLLRLQADSTANPEVKSVLQDATSRVQSMRIIYDKLLLSKDLREISIKNYIENLIGSIHVLFVDKDNIIIEKDITDFNIITKQATTIGIIINELITNALKYAFKDRDKGTVSISIKKAGNMITIIIQDNGIGIDERIMKNKSTGFGLTIVKMLVEQLKGTYSIVNENGTKSIVQFET